MANCAACWPASWRPSRRARRRPWWGDPPGAAAARRAPDPAAGRRPAYLAALGRTAELERLAGWLADPAVRLITLYGLGGSGKTRLATQALALAEVDFYQGACFISLAVAHTAAEALAALAAGLGLELQARRPAVDQVADYLRERELLVSLDNVEQLLAPGAEAF